MSVELPDAIYRAIRYCRVADKAVWVAVLQTLFGLTETEAETLYRWIRGGAKKEVHALRHSQDSDVITITAIVTGVTK